jgi:hypothetical protein
MGWVRDFSVQEGLIPAVRSVEDAPQAMRQELVDHVYHVLEIGHGRPSADDIYFVIIQSLGFYAAGNPMGGRRQRVGRDIGNADWPRVFDLICRLWHEFQRHGLHEIYGEGVNRILAANHVAWDLQPDGHLRRVLPVPANAQVSAAVAELTAVRFAPALQLFNAARDAFDDRPRRDRDACANVFDALESVAKERFAMPAATFGQVLTYMRQAQVLNEQVIAILEAVNTLEIVTSGTEWQRRFALILRKWTLPISPVLVQF